jgi:hypothetical protein
MTALSRMYNSYDATCWLNKPRRALKGSSVADLLKDGDTQGATTLLRKEGRYKQLFSKLP